MSKDEIADLKAEIDKLKVQVLEARIAALEGQAAARQPMRDTVSAPLPAPPMGGPVTGNFRPVAASLAGSETEVVSTPEQAVIRSRQARRDDMAPPVLRLGGAPDNGPVLKASPTYDVRSNGPVFTKPASMSGRTR